MSCSKVQAWVLRSVERYCGGGIGGGGESPRICVLLEFGGMAEMLWKTESEKSRCLTSGDLRSKGKNHLLLVRVLKKKRVSITELICTRKPGFGASLVSCGLMALQRASLIQKYNKQMANSTVSRSNGGIKVNQSLPDGSCFDRCLTQVCEFPKQCLSVPVNRQPLPFYECLHHRSVY